MAREILNTNLDPLPTDMRNGMIAMGLLGLVSTIASFTLMSFITYRMVYWKRYYDRPIHRNQIFVLIYNLLLADFQQALSFLLSFYWVAQGKLVGGNTTCFGQGWLIQIGDVSSGLWVLAIAIHTFLNLVAQKQIRHTTFVAAVICIWVFSLLLTAMGPILSKDEFFVPAGAWVSSFMSPNVKLANKFQSAGLVTHMKVSAYTFTTSGFSSHNSAPWSSTSVSSSPSVAAS
jgi:hypothetical protein